MGFFLVAIVLVLAIFAINFSRRTGLPSLLLFLVLGLVANNFISFDNYYIVDKFSTLALVIIMFYGGFGTSWKMGKPVVKQAAVLSSLGTAATALITGAFAYYVLKFPILESFLLGSIVGSTDYASVANALSSQNLNLKYRTGSILELESGSNDPFAYTLTMIFLSLILGTEISIPIMIIMQISLGLILGFAFAWLVSKLFEIINLAKDGLAIVFMSAMALLAYSFTVLVGGNGFLAVYIFGITIGNKQFLGKRDIVFFFDGLSELMNIGLFFILGLLATPEKILATLPIAIVIMLFMTFVSRPVSVFGLMLPFKLKFNQLLTLSWAGLRGAAAIAFAIMAVNSGANFSIDIYHIVFGICLVSSLIQGSLMSPVAKWTKMVDPSDTKYTSFNAHSDKGRISFLKTVIEPGSTLIGQQVKDLNMNFDYIVAKIERNGETVIPRGNVEFKEGDVVVIGGAEYFDEYGQDLIEFTLSENHPYSNHKLRDLNLSENKLILTIARNDVLIPAEGDTMLLPGDRVLLLFDDEAHIHYEDEPENQDQEHVELRVKEAEEAATLEQAALEEDISGEADIKLLEENVEDKGNHE